MSSILPKGIVISPHAGYALKSTDRRIVKVINHASIPAAL